MLKQSYFIWGSLLLWPLAHFLIAVAHQPIAWANLGNPFRAVLAIGVFAFLACIRTDLTYLKIGIGLACIATFLHSVHDRFIIKVPRALGWFNNEIHYGDYSSLVGLLAIVIALLAHQRSSLWRSVLFMLGCLAYLAAAASGTRTALSTLVCLIPLFLAQKQDLLHRRLRLIFLVGLCSVAVLTAFSERIREETRISAAISDVNNMLAGRSQSSIGDRKQMWVAALDMAHTSPLLGIGLNKFRQELDQRIESKKILPLADPQNQAHSQVLHSLATGGVFLLLAYLAFSLAPFVWFYRMYRQQTSSTDSRLLAYMGMTTVVSHTIFGLTNAIFDLQVFSSLYFLSVATFAGLCIKMNCQMQHNIIRKQHR